MLWKCLNYLRAREVTETCCGQKLLALRAAQLFSLNSIPKTKLKIQRRNVLWGWIRWLLQSTNINTECQFATALCRQQRESEVRWRNKVLSLDCFQSATSAFAMQSWGRTPHSATPPYHSGILAAANFHFQIKQVQKKNPSLVQGVHGTPSCRAGFEAILSRTRGEAEGHIAAQSLHGQQIYPGFRRSCFLCPLSIIIRHIKELICHLKWQDA